MAKVIFEHLGTYSKQLDKILVKHSLLEGSWELSDKATKDNNDDAEKEEDTEGEEEEEAKGGKKGGVWKARDESEVKQLVSLVKEILVKVAMLDPSSTSPKRGE